MHPGSRAASQGSKLAISRPELQIRVRLSEELTDCERVTDGNRPQGAAL